GKWNGLGGKFQPGESPEECARREILEASGLRCDQLELKGTITFPLFDGKDDWYVFLFNAYDPQGEPVHPPEGELSWIDDAEIDALPLWPGDRIFMPWLNHRKFFSAKFVYEQNELKKHSVEFYG